MQPLTLNWTQPPVGPLAAPAAGVDLWLVDAGVDEAAESQARAILSPDELARYDRVRVIEKRQQAIAVRAALRRILARYVAAEPHELVFAYGPQEKPSLAAPATSPRLQFNVSHAGAWGLAAITAGRPVGVDIELTRPLQNQASFARTILSPRELQQHESFAAGDHLAALLAAWTCKEAVLKAAGLGMAVAPAALELTPVDDKRCEAETCYDGESRRWQVVALQAAADYAAAVAVPAHQPLGELRAFDCSQSADR
ncbi:MAG: hypothetical protein CMJ58_07035 [Planctomycetaceae bacterium]|nr:hypothetical protein [Planctomycetaceae bacterium]